MPEEIVVEDVYRRYFDALPGYVSVQDRAHRLLSVNQRFAEDFGAEAGGLCYRVYKHGTVPCAKCPVGDTFRDGEPRTREEILRRRDGTEMRVLIRTSPVRDASGAIVSVVKTATDITEIKRLQLRCRTLFEEVPCYISVQDRNRRILEANRRFRDDFGDALEGHCYEVYKHRTEPCLMCPVSMTFEDGESHVSEEIVTARDGRHINVLVYTAAIRDPNGEITSVMEMSTNITELRRLESQLASLGLVVGSISHGIKGLLNGLNGGIYLVETGFGKDDSERVRRGWEMVRRNIERIRSMVLNVLYYAKDRELQREAIDPGALARDVIEVLSRRAVDLGVTLEARVEEALAPLDADPRALHSLLVNLVENSLDACRTDAARPDHHVSLDVHRDGDDVLFEVVDNGIGMDQETRERAFSAFFSSKGTEGTGLGLFVAQKIAAAHGGTITIDSTLHVGTRFRVRIPPVKPAASSLPPGDPPG